MISTAAVSGIGVLNLERKKLPIRVLLIEDNHTSRQLMSDYLEYHGYEVFSLSRATALSEVMPTIQPNIVLLDLKLPDIDGFAVLEMLRQEPSWRQIPVIIVSAYAFQADQQRALSLGARRYLVKPVNLAYLRQSICEELGILSM